MSSPCLICYKYIPTPDVRLTNGQLLHVACLAPAPVSPAMADFVRQENVARVKLNSLRPNYSIGSVLT